jgi:hypothetical protein
MRGPPPPLPPRSRRTVLPASQKHVCTKALAGHIITASTGNRRFLLMATQKGEAIIGLFCLLQNFWAAVRPQRPPHIKGSAQDAAARLRALAAGTAQHPCLCQPRISVASGSFLLVHERRFSGSRGAMKEENATGWLMQLFL